MKTMIEKQLTETELELMSILWKLGEGSVNDVKALLSKERDLAYTSVSTILRILEQKGILKSKKEGRGHVYMPLVSKATYETLTIRDVVEKVFDGTAISLVKRLIDTQNLKDVDFDELEDLIRKANPKNTKGSKAK